jgi:hypothetical protein
MLEDKDYKEICSGDQLVMFKKWLEKVEAEGGEEFQFISEMTKNKGFYKAGWYQDKEGKLYHYDGVLWDEVPEEKVVNLEHLG